MNPASNAPVPHSFGSGQIYFLYAMMVPDNADGASSFMILHAKPFGITKFGLPLFLDLVGITTQDTEISHHLS